jgi:hypothetical protein
MAAVSTALAVPVLFPLRPKAPKRKTPPSPPPSADELLTSASDEQKSVVAPVKTKQRPQLRRSDLPQFQFTGSAEQRPAFMSPTPEPCSDCKGERCPMGPRPEKPSYERDDLQSESPILQGLKEQYAELMQRQAENELEMIQSLPSPVSDLAN